MPYSSLSPTCPPPPPPLPAYCRERRVCMCYVFFCSLLSGSLSKRETKRVVSEGEEAREEEVTFNLTVGSDISHFHPHPHPPLHPLLCILIFYFCSRARCCLSSLQHILSPPPPQPHPHPILSLTPLPQTHTHSFNLFLCISPSSTPSTSPSFQPSLGPPEAAGGP